MTAKGKTPKHGDTQAERLTDAMRKGGARPKRTSLYTGDLAQPLNFSVPTEEFLRASPEEFAALIARLESERMAEIRRRLDLLFAHYHLERSDYIGLAHALAFAHVPGLQVAPRQRRPGRPTKQQKALADVRRKAESTGQNVLALLAEIMNPTKVKGRSGRPVRWDERLLRGLVARADDWKQSEKAQGRRASDADFVRAFCKDRAHKTGERASDVFKRHGRTFVVALSRARKSVSKS